MKNRMKERFYGVTYPLPTWLQIDFVWKLWSRFMCPQYSDKDRLWAKEIDSR